MSKNISKLSGRVGLKNNLFQKISERSLKSNKDEGIKEIADQYKCLNQMKNLFLKYFHPKVLKILMHLLIHL